MAHAGSDLTGLFSSPEPSRRGFPAFAVSVALHGIGFGFLAYAFIHAPVIRTDPMSSRYRVRHLDLHLPETAATRAAEALYPTRTTGSPVDNTSLPRPASASGNHEPAAKLSFNPPPPAMRLPDGGQGRQILIQPQVREHVVLPQETPVPTVMLWTPEQKPAVRIVPPPPDKPSTANVQTSIEVPNEQMDLSDIPLTAAARPSQVQTPPAGTSTPVATRSLDTVRKPPATVSKTQSEPTPAAVLSASDLRMNDGTAVLPPLNETRGQSQKDGSAAGQQTRVLGAGNNAGSGKSESPAGAGNGANAVKPNAQAGSAATALAQNTGPKTGVSQAGSQSGDPQQFAAGETSEHIQLPRDGKFGVVVVGTSLAEQYPETLAVWSDRVAYTAYLHVGTPKAWILQYSQLRSQDAAAAGTVSHLVAPWPYDIMRPNLLARDLNADALMIHGILNESGRLENLAIAYPQGYLHTSFVLSQLRLWQFRPAQQQGKPTAVEVLLIIPEDED